MKLTPELLRKLIKEEASKLDSDIGEEEPVEVDADEYADTLEKHHNFIKALKMEESRLNKRLMKIRESKSKALKSLAKKI